LLTVAAVLGLLGIGAAARAQALPGLGPLPDPQSAPGLSAQAYGWILMQQAELHRELVSLMRALKEGAPGALFALIGGAFLYGLFHAMGPGHGKLVISSYAFASGSAIRSSLLLTLVSSLAQAVSAILLVGGLVMVLGMGSRLSTLRDVYWLELVSYSLIPLLGLAMLVRALRGKRGCCAGHAHRHHGGAPAIPKRDFWAMVLSVGIRPCSGAVIVLLFTMGQDLFMAGVTATLAMAMGTAFAVGALALIPIVTRRGLLSATARNGVWRARLGQVFAVTGATAAVVMGSMMLWLAAQSGPTY